MLPNDYSNNYSLSSGDNICGLLSLFTARHEAKIMTALTNPEAVKTKQPNGLKLSSSIASFIFSG